MTSVTDTLLMSVMLALCCSLLADRKLNYLLVQKLLLTRKLYVYLKIVNGIFLLIQATSIYGFDRKEAISVIVPL